MQCPYCGGEMKTGVIQARAAWFAEKARHLGPQKQDVQIVRPNIWGGSSCSPAYCCETCKKVVISWEDEQ